MPSSTVSADDAALAIVSGTSALDDGFFWSRWNRANRSEQRLMMAMAQDGDQPSAVADLVTRLGKRRQSDISVVRKSLIAKGLVYSPARGELIFAVPRMADYIARNFQPGPPLLFATV